MFAGTGVLTQSMHTEGFTTFDHDLYRTGDDVLADGYLSRTQRLCEIEGISHVHFGLHCVTWSRANVQAKGKYRDDTYVDGYPWLMGTKRQRMLDGNAHADVTLAFVKWLCSTGRTFTVDNPIRSLVWKYKEFLLMVKEAKLFVGQPNARFFWISTNYCQWGAKWQKQIGILTNCSALLPLANKCRCKRKFLVDGKLRKHSVILQGAMKHPKTKKWVSRTNLLGNKYPKPMTRSWAKLLAGLH